MATTAPARVATKPVSGWRSRRGGAAGRKRSAAEAELSDLSDEEEAAAAACSSEKASPMEAELTPRPSTRRRAANGVAALVALELEGEEGATAAAAARALPPRAAAVGSPAGRRRRLTGLGVDVLADAAADAAAGAGDATSGGTAAAVAGQAAARPPATRQRRGLAAQDAAQELQAAAAAAAEPVATRQRRQQATALAGAAQQQAASVDEAAAPDEAAAGTAGPATFQLAAHHQATRARTMAAQDKRAARVAKSRGGEEPGPFAVGDAVLLWVKPNGRIGRTIDAKRLACRVVGVRTAFGHQTRYRLRCNAGVLKGNYADGVTAALPDAAAKLTFSGTATTGRGIKSGVRPVQGLKKDADIAAGRA